MSDYREIGTFGQNTILMSLEDLFKIADKEVKAYSESLEHEVGNLQWKLEQAIEALKFYAEQKHITTKNTDGIVEPTTLWLGFVEDGTKARKVLEECGI